MKLICSLQTAYKTHRMAWAELACSVTEKAAVAGLALAAAWFTGLYLYIAWQTLAYPFAMDWSEPNLFMPVLRIRGGLPVYSEPALDYVPNLYTPLFYYAAAAVSVVTGPVLLAARLVSFAAILGTGALVYRWLRREGATHALAFCGTGLLFATYFICGEWFHIARPDSLFLFFLWLGFYLLRFGNSDSSALAAGVVLAAAFLTKQTALIAAACMLAGAFTVSPRRGMIAAASWGVLCALSVLVLCLASGNWFWFYAVEVPLHHNVAGGAWISFWTQDLVPLWPAITLAVTALVLDYRHTQKQRLFMPAAAAGFIITSYTSRLHDGGFVNVLMPVYFFLTFSAVRGVLWLKARMATQQPGADRHLPYMTALALCALQFSMLRYDPALTMPTPADRLDGAHLLSYISQIRGKVLIPQYPFIATQAGKKSYGWGTAGWDILRMDTNPVQQKFDLLVSHALRTLQFSTILLTSWERLPGGADIYNPYCYKENIFTNDSFHPVTGAQFRPSRVFVPCRPPTLGPPKRGKKQIRQNFPKP